MRRLILALALLALIGCAQSPPTVTVGGEALLGQYVEDGSVAAFFGNTVSSKRAPEPGLCALFETWHDENYLRD